MTAAADKVKVVVVFAPGGENEGKTVDMDVDEARNLVREGRVRYATDAQEKKAEK